MTPFAERNIQEAALATPTTSWNQFEANLAPGSAIVLPQERIASFQVPVHLSNRRVYCYREVVPGAGCSEYRISGRIAFRRNGRVVGDLPYDFAQVASGSALIFDSAAAISSANSGPTGMDCLELQLSRRFSSAVRSVLLSPMRLKAEADEVSFDISAIITDAGAIEAVKLFVGVLSMR